MGALGIAQIQTGQASDAVSNLQAALAKTPNDLDLRFYLSQASEMLAQQSLDALTAADPNSSRSHQVRAHSYYLSHQFPEAEKEYEQALTLRPDVPGLHLELGEVYAASSQWAKADEQFLAETRLQPGNGEAAYRLGDARLQEGKPAAALKELERSDLLRPDMPETLYSLGKAAVLAGDAAAAQRALTRVIALERESPLAAQAHYTLARLYRQQGRRLSAKCRNSTDCRTTRAGNKSGALNGKVEKRSQSVIFVQVRGWLRVKPPAICSVSLSAEVL